jgi:WASH complex subunit 7
MMDCQLPGNAHYSASLDVLEIMRNIHVFVARYNYSLNTQVFVERSVDQKHLHVIDIEHLTQSIRTHGTGIMNTTVNFTYQFLCRKLMLVSEFLFDDQVKSPLARLARHFKQHKDELNNLFPYSKAEALVKELRKLGMSETGMTCLDQLRLQVTEIGNALGYVRMVRSGGLRHSAMAVQCVPDLHDVELFKPKVQMAQLSDHTVTAAATLDRVVDDLTTHVAEGTEYFLVLVKIFRDSFMTDEHAHLRNFYALIPALCISFVEAMLGKKEKLSKRSGRAEAAFTDDGFSLGVAYLLKLFQQDAAFDACHWFASAQQHLADQRRSLQDGLTQARKTRNRTFDVEHTEYTLKRLEALMVEFELLCFSLTGARIFFRDLAAQPEGQEEENADAQAPVAAAAPVAAPAAAAAPPAPSLTDVPQAPDLGFFL